MRTYEVTRGPHYYADATMAVPEPWETAFTSYFLRKVSLVMGISFISVSTFVWKELVHSLAEHFQTPVNKLNDVNINYLKIPKKTSRTAQNAFAGHMWPRPRFGDPWPNSSTQRDSTVIFIELWLSCTRHHLIIRCCVCLEDHRLIPYFGVLL